MPKKRIVPPKARAYQQAAEERIAAIAAKGKKPPKSVLLSTKALNTIRDTYKRGKRTVAIDGILFKLRRTGRYLVVKPAKQKFPLANVQIESGPSPKLQEWAEKPVEPRSQRWS